VSHLPIKSWHIINDGFSRHEGRPDGCNWWWREINALSSDTCVVEYRTWHYNYPDLADQIKLFTNGDPPDVRLYGYSYGGYSVIRLARQLYDRDIPVRSIVLADAVYRHWYALGQWRSMVPWSVLHIPPNVREVFWFRQKNPRFAFYRNNEFTGWNSIAMPAGHDVVADDISATIVHEPQILHCQHSFVDSHPLVKARVIQVANQTVQAGGETVVGVNNEKG
jgi:pimeloyl-ACP methyl ester carboxylesterase